METLKS